MKLRSKWAIVTNCLMLGVSTMCFAEPATTSWHASWISGPKTSPTEEGVYHFRREFDLADKPSRFPIRVSADNRYRLYVNGVEVSNGPARGDLLHWRYESLDIAPHLHAGRNVVAALVWNMGLVRPAAQMTLGTAFVLEGETPEAQAINTGKDWKVYSDPSYSFAKVEGPATGGFYVAGPSERMDAAKYPWGWEQPSYDASKWANAGPIVQQFASPVALSRGTQMNGSAAEWQLLPRTIPLPEQTPIHFASVRRASGVRVPANFVTGRSPLVIPARSRASVLLDNGTMTIGYPVLKTSGGADARATLTYAESLVDAQGNKGNRNEVNNKSIVGLTDEFRFDGGQDRRFQPLWLRAWRYMQIDIETGDEPLRIDEASSIFAAYPFEQHAEFDSDAKWLKPIWDLDWHGLRLGAFETFWDTPYYEQLQYVGDTRLESVMAIYQSGDDRLVRNAIELFDDSRLAEGLTASSYPSSLRQQIPSFSLWWIGMVHDYWMLRDDPAFVRARLQGMRSVIGWFEQHLDETGLLGPLPWWCFLDWAKNWPNGNAPDASNGHSVAISLQFALVLKEAAELEKALGRPSEGEHDAALADRIISAARARGWDAERGLFRDSLEHKTFSQHTNTLAVLAGAVPGGDDQKVMEKVLGDQDLEAATFYFRFYVDEAMRRAGLASRYLSRLTPWREMIRNGMTSTAETPEPTRSDSHAWSAHPNYELLATVLGIRPASAGFREVLVEPELGSLKWASGSMPHPNGTISVRFEKVGADGLRGGIDLPPNTTGRFVHAGQRVDLLAGHTDVRCASKCVTQQN